MNILAELGAFAAEATMSSQEAYLRDIQRLHFVDALFAALAGRTTGEAGTLAPTMGGSAASARLTEIDDIHCASCTTPSSAIVPAALWTLATEPDADPVRLADAVWVGTELMTRFGAAIDGARILYRGIWPSYFCAPLGVAATVGRLIGLDAATMTNALANALDDTSGMVNTNHPVAPSRWQLFATAVETGAGAAHVARAGKVGNPRQLDGPQWLPDSHGIELNTAALTDGLGARSIYDELSLKPFCSAKQSIAAVDAMRELLADGLDPAAIEAVEVRVPPDYAGMISRTAEAGDRASTMISVAYQIALAALRPDAQHDIDRSNVPFDDAVVGLASRVTVEPESDAVFCAGFPARFPARVVVKAGGRVYEREVYNATGDPGRRLDDAGLSDKIARVCATLPEGAGVDETVMSEASALIDPGAAKSLAARFHSLFAA